MGFKQVIIQRVNQHLDALRIRRVPDPEFVANRREQFHRRQPGIQNERDVRLGRELPDKTPGEGCLAGPDFAGQLNETARLLHPIHKMRKPLAVALAHKEKTRIGRQRERRLAQSEVVRVHASALIPVDGNDGLFYFTEQA
jgi:hypothetical protein